MSNLDYTFGKLMTGDALFLKFFIYSFVLTVENSPYVISNLPGIREGLTSTILSGYNVGIIKHIDQDKLSSAVKVVEFMTSKETQKIFVMNEIIVSAMSSLYKEKDVCDTIINCEMYQDVQPILKPVDITDNYNEYSIKYTNYFFNFLYRNADASKTLKAMDDILRVYDVGLNSKETPIGLITFIVFSVTIVLIICSLALLFSEKYNKLFSFLSKPSWCLVILGIISVFSIGFTKIGELTSFKCQLNTFFLFMSSSLVYVPIFSNLLIEFPAETGISKWVEKNKQKFISVLICFSLILNGLLFIDSYKIEEIVVSEGQNFRVCKIKNTFTVIINTIIIIYTTILFLCVLFLIFLEWNLTKLFIDLRFVVSSIYLNVITSVVLFIFSYFHISNYKLHFGLYVILVYIMGVVNYLTLYGFRVILPKLMKKDDESEIIEKIRVHQSSYQKSENITAATGGSNTYSNGPVSTISINSENSRTSTSSKANSLVKKMLDYHYNRSSKSLA